MDEKDIKKIAVIILAIALVILSFIILRPIILAIITGLILGYIFYPVYKFLFKFTKSPNLSAFLMCLFIILLIFLPLWFIVPMLVKQVFELYTLYTQKLSLVSSLKGAFPSVFASEVFTNEFATALNNLVSKIANTIMSSFSDLFVNIPAMLLQAIVALFVFFFVMRDAKLLGTYAKSLSPLNKDLEESLIKKFKDMTFGVIYGHIVVGMIQGAITGIGLAVFGVPNVLLLTFVAMLAATIPFVGAWLVWLPASLILVASEKIGPGIGLFVYGALFVSWIDNIIRPYIIAKRTEVHQVIIFIGMIGGLVIFGVIGLFLGPLILSYLLILLELYKQKKLFS